MNFFEDFIGGSSLLDLPPNRGLDSACLFVKKGLHAQFHCPAAVKILSYDCYDMN